MCELTLEACGFTADEARVSRRAYDLTTPPEQRVTALKTLLAHAPDGGWHVCDAPPGPVTPHKEKAA